MAKTPERKKFFESRSASEIRALVGDTKTRNPNVLYEIEKVVPRLLDITDPNTQAILLKSPLIPNRFYNSQSWHDANRKWFKHGALVFPARPKTQEQAYQMKRLPIEELAVALNHNLVSVPLGQIEQVGHGMHPVQGNDRRERKIPFLFDLQGYQIFDYARSGTVQGIEIKPYEDSQGVSLEGAEIEANVPSRNKGETRKQIRWSHVPVERNKVANAIITSVRPDFYEGEIPENVKFAQTRFTYRDQRRSSDISIIAPQAIAAYHGIANQYLEEGNRVPHRANPFIIPTQNLVDLYKRIGSNLLIYDPTIRNGKGGVRKPHQAEASNLIAQGISYLGIRESMQNPRNLSSLPQFNWDRRE